MIIGRSGITELCRGLVSVTENEDGSLSPVRFTEKQLAFFSRTESDRIRSIASSGISLCCSTDAESIQLVYEVDFGSSQDIYGFDVYVDGALYYHTDARITEKPSGCLDVRLPNGEKTVEVFFPNLAVLKIRHLELAGASYAEPISLPKFLFLGDSIIQGYTTAFPSLTLAGRLSRALDVQILNQGLAGVCYEPDSLDRACDPECILTAIGTNDWYYREKEEFAVQAEAYYKMLMSIYPGIPVKMITPVWRADAETPMHKGFAFSDVDCILTETASACGIEAIKGIDLIPHIPELFYDRQVHPNELGCAYYAENLIKHL